MPCKSPTADGGETALSDLAGSRVDENVLQETKAPLKEPMKTRHDFLERSQEKDDLDKGDLDKGESLPFSVQSIEKMLMSCLCLEEAEQQKGLLFFC